jgi:hypothetical protein
MSKLYRECFVEEKMRRIKQIEALDILIAWNKTGFYKIDLDYGLIPPKKELPGEDGNTQSYNLPIPKPGFTKEDFLKPEYRASRNMLTISTLHSRD